MKADIRENLIATMGMHAGCLLGEGLIKIPDGNEGEDVLADFIAESVSVYEKASEIDQPPFDLFSEEILMDRFGLSRSEFIPCIGEEYEVVCRPWNGTGDSDGFVIFHGIYRKCCDVWNETRKKYDQWHPCIRSVRK